MISVDQALELIDAQRRDFGTETLALPQCIGRLLAEAVFADRDFPPFHRVTMDGIAISYRSWEQGFSRFRVQGLQPAGHPTLSLDAEDACIEVMTGAMLPGNADAVIPYEDCIIGDGLATLTVPAIRKYQNIHLQGTDGTAGAQLLSKNRRITPAVAAVIATVGKEQVLVRKRPRIAICSTGDELVDIAEIPAAHQIRRSNSYMLAAALAAEGIAADTYHLRDSRKDMQTQLERLLQAYEVILLSGAVSKGKYDFLPEVLTELGMQTIFHRVAQRPGKPMLFGTCPGGAVVFGFPGNPVSTLICYHVYFLAWLHASMNCKPAPLSARLATDVEFRAALAYHLPVTLRMQEGILEATPCVMANSGDMLSLHRADAIITLPADRVQFVTGQAFPLRLLSPFDCMAG